MDFRSHGMDSVGRIKKVQKRIEWQWCGLCSALHNIHKILGPKTGVNMQTLIEGEKNWRWISSSPGWTVCTLSLREVLKENPFIGPVKAQRRLSTGFVDLKRFGFYLNHAPEKQKQKPLALLRRGQGCACFALGSSPTTQNLESGFSWDQTACLRRP